MRLFIFWIFTLVICNSALATHLAKRPPLLFQWKLNYETPNTEIRNFTTHDVNLTVSEREGESVEVVVNNQSYFLNPHQKLIFKLKSLDSINVSLFLESRSAIGTFYYS